MGVSKGGGGAADEVHEFQEWTELDSTAMVGVIFVFAGMKAEL